MYTIPILNFFLQKIMEEELGKRGVEKINNEELKHLFSSPNIFG